MRRAGVLLIFASVVVRGVVRMAGERWFGLTVILLVVYGLLLALAESRAAARWLPRSAPSGAGGLVQGQGAAPAERLRWVPPLYLLLQTGLVAGMLAVPPMLDFFGLLLIPLSIQAVFLFGPRVGSAWIALFFLAMFGPMAFDEKGWVFGLTMSVLNTGYCLLFSGYARQVQSADAARGRNERLLAELQSAHRQLQGHAAQAEGLAAERERGRLARELHDSVTQTVFSMNLTVQSARLLLEREPQRAAMQLERLEELASGAMGEIQALVSKLSPPSVAEEGLPAALRRLAAERAARDGLQVRVEVSGESDGATPALPAAVVEGLAQIAQESLANVAKHAGTREATLHLHVAKAASFFEIVDDGRGFDPDAAQGTPGHLGLAGMAERAREIGWRLSVESRPGSGTRVLVEESPPGGAA